MKLNDLSKLSALLTDEEKSTLEVEEAKLKSKRRIGEGQSVRVLLDTKARRGKAVTVISGLALSSEMRDKLAKELKQKMSAGGTVHNDEIELQGDHVIRVVRYLQENGFSILKK